MSRKKNRIFPIDVHLQHNPTRPFVLRGKLRDQRLGHYELIDGMTLHGLVTGDVVTCGIAEDGTRHLTGLESLRLGTLGTVSAVGQFCGDHMRPMLEQTAEDWAGTGCQEVDAVENGLISGFWPASIPREDAEMAVDRTAEEFNLTAFVAGLSERMLILQNSLDLADPTPWEEEPAA